MSEHLGSHWATGAADQLQPLFRTWRVSPKACLLAGAAASLGASAGVMPQVPAGASVAMPSSVSSCSIPLGVLPVYPPSTHPACTGWGVFYPRTGSVVAESATTAALMVASRMESLAQEVFGAGLPAGRAPRWQMITPTASACFGEGENIGVLQIVKGVNEAGRLRGHLRNYVFALWKPVSCVRDWALVPAAPVLLSTLEAACRAP